MELAKKITILDKIYAVYDDFVAKLDLACKENCAYCCTTNVILTTLEGYKIISRRASNQKSDLIQKVKLNLTQKRFQPKITTNHLATLCAQGIDPPDETIESEEKKCSLLADSLCSIYKLRPFGCRCLVSRYNCGEKGYAEIDDFVISVNTVILQTIEHVDINGLTGNLMDVLNVMSSEDNQTAYKNNALNCQTVGLISNHPLKVLMIPPEHRTRMEPILQALRQIKI
ncbi:MAG: YkgJ family cysteine cluster protein [Desulfobacterales bacterium]|nr:MAG: YkgJ family cysteine cluster protein [Desulfobacterales bacterium]